MLGYAGMAVVRIRWRKTSVGVALITGLFVCGFARAEDREDELWRRINHAADLRRDGHLPEAEKEYLALLKEVRAEGNEYYESIVSLNLSSMYKISGRYPEALKLAEKAYAGLRRWKGEDDQNTMIALTILADVYQELNRFGEAEQMLRRVLDYRLRTAGDTEEYWGAQATLGSVLSHAGRYAEAEKLLLEVLVKQSRQFGESSIKVAHSCHNLGSLYLRIDRKDQAEKYLRRALNAYAGLGAAADVPRANTLSTLGRLYYSTDRDSEAVECLLERQRILVRTLGPDHPVTVDQSDLADVYVSMKFYDQAEGLLRTQLEFDDKYYGPHSSESRTVLQSLLFMLMRAGRFDDAQPVSQRIQKELEGSQAAPASQAQIYLKCALLARYSDHIDDACRLIARVVQLYEQSRGDQAGGEQDVAATAAGERKAYAYAAEYHFFQEQDAEGFAFCEAGRSRGLWDQMALAHADLYTGIEPQKAAKMRRLYEGAQTNIVQLENKLSMFDRQHPNRTDASRDERQKLLDQLSYQRQYAMTAYSAIRSESPLYRQVLARKFEGASLEKVQTWLGQQKALLLYYLFDNSTVILQTIDAESHHAQYCVAEGETAKEFGIEEGLLDGDELRPVLMNEQQTGVLQQMSNPPGNPDLVRRLHALAQLLLNQNAADKLKSGKYEQVIIIPDGPLALLPFEGLIDELGDKPKYFLDVAPPIHYAPSATILLQLAGRPEVPLPSDREPVLALGDPAYPTDPQEQLARLDDGDQDRASFSRLGAKLNRLPHSGTEATWVARNFTKHGMRAGVLKAETATEAAIRAHAKDRHIVHLACHGLVDQQLSNFFGGLALAPGARGGVSPRDDGLLTLNEINDLDLRACELAILSACQTNYGPQVEGEGTWALSRGFLVAGARRVVASNWLVDDEAAASLISYFCGIVAKQSEAGQQIDYAQALAEAKHWVREQPKWERPYYWASFVLVGPR